MQVFGGHGFIHEWGMEQYVRDARINMIYEGTNTIQSLDLLGRKVLGNNGATLKKFGKKIAAFIEEEGTNEAMQEFVNPLADLGDKVNKLTQEIGMKAFGNPDEVVRCSGGLPARGRPHDLRLLSSRKLPRSHWPRRTAATRSTPPSWPRRASTSPSCCPRRPA